ncbi:MAG: AGE family epimerase/isomerase [Tannerellaceae bacterium]|jgi:mannobiose 2-epimerase|nr:AGE family epimerase/isomerase [Tannerellaceae bacterium]
MRKYIETIVILLTLLIASCSDKKESEEKLHLMREEIMNNLLTNILPFWEVYAPDPSGGFYGALQNDGAPLPGSPKSLLLNARILWAFSSAYRAFEVENYKQIADRAQEYLIHHFIDPQYGGVYWSLTPTGQPADTNKHTCALTATIYALAEHYRATAQEESRLQAIALYNTLQTHNWHPSGNTISTHTYLLEALANLYRIWPDEQLKEQLTALLHHFHTQPASCMHHTQIAWQLYEAATLIGDKALTDKTKKLSIALANAQLRKARTPAKGNIPQWHPQAEAIITFINAWQLTGKAEYATAAIASWSWIKDYLVDHEYGEWYHSADENNLPITSLPKASIWKSPYHNTRMALETITRIP